jgi:chromosome partitioning related protein ParA
MQVVSIISTKGGVGKTTTAANLGGLAADAGLRVLLLDLDVQPTLSSYYELTQRAPGGIYELLAFNERDLGQLVSRTIIAGLDLVLSNDHRGELNTLLLHAPDGRLRLRHLLPVLRPHYDLVLIDTQGARSACCWRWRCSRPISRCRRSRRKSSRHASCGAARCN